MKPFEILEELQAAREKAQSIVDFLLVKSITPNYCREPKICHSDKLLFMNAIESAIKAAHDIDMLMINFIKERVIGE